MQKFALLGHPVEHSLSPKMHAASFEALGFSATYEAFDVMTEDVEEKLKELIFKGYRGVNVTIPHKKTVMPFLTHLDDSVIRYDAVNTIVINRDGTTVGYNTDVYGFLTDLEENGVKVEGAKILMLGAGGAGGALAEGLREAGCAELKIANRTLYNDKMIPLGSAECIEVARSSDLIVNVTPLGLKEDDPPALPAEAFHEGQTFYDCAPTAHMPSTVRTALRAGARAFNGRGFLVHQGARAFEIWTGLKADLAAMSAAIA